MIKDKVAEFNPEANQVKTESGQTISYDFLVVATGLVLDYGQIKGLEGVGHSAEANPEVSKKWVKTEFTRFIMLMVL